MQIRSVLAAAVACALPAVAQAAPFADNFNSAASSANWTVNKTTDTVVTFGYDYSVDGIPAAPRSGGSTLGLKLSANNTDTTASSDGITMTPTGVLNSTNYSITFDAWMNTVGPFPAGGTSSTFYVGAGVGYNGTTINRHTATGSGTTVGSGAWFVQAGDAGFSSTSTSARDYMAFRNSDAWINNATEPTVYFATDDATNDAQDHTNAYYQTIFPGTRNVPAAQQPANPPGTGTSAGTPTFRWVKWDVVVADGKVTWYVDGTPVGTLNGSPTLLLDGLTSLTYFDPNTGGPSAAGAPFTFGIVDNFEIVIPEPSSLAAVGLGGLALLRRRGQ